MTRRATFTKADLARAVRVAEEFGKVALVLPQGIALVDPASVALPSPDDPVEGNSCDKAFGL